jgi:hypothetical protein
MKILSALAGFILFGAMSAAEANPVDVSFVASGSAGNWTLDFSVTNNLGGTNDIYFFGVRLPAQNVTGSPALWNPNAPPGYNPSIYGGSNTDYNNIWITCPTASCIPGFPGDVVAPSETLSSFQVLDTDSALPISVGWFAVASGGHYTGAGCSFICGAPGDNPGFEGFAAAAATPLPGTMLLFAAALAMLGGVFRWKKRVLATA